jgi:phosphoribosylanthranilate isomerase
MERPLIKVCGICRDEDARCCEENGVDLLGFIFHPASPRYVAPETAGRIKIRKALKVGVFGADQSLSGVMKIMKIAGLDLAQLHGAQDVSFCRDLGPERIIKVMWPQRYERAQDFTAEMEKMAGVAACFLFDAGRSGGGHGRALAEEYLPADAPRPWFLAGGLTGEAIGKIKRYDALAGFDFNSGVETGPGRKDHHLLKAAVAAVEDYHSKGKPGP